MKLTKLSPVLSEKVAQLEARLSKFKLGPEEIKKNLKDIEANNCNLCYVLLDKQNDLIGYIMAWLTNSQFVIDETVAFIDDFVILPNYESYKYTLIKAVIKNLEEKKLTGTPIEATVLNKHVDLWINDTELEEKTGYTLSNSFTYSDKELGEELVLLRFESIN